MARRRAAASPIFLEAADISHISSMSNNDYGADLLPARHYDGYVFNNHDARRARM